MKKRVFIIGAGASSIYGIPIANEYLQTCLEYGISSGFQNINLLEEYLNRLIPGGKEVYGKLAFEQLLSIMQKDRMLTQRLMGVSMGVDAEKILIGCLCKFLWHRSNNIIIKGIEKSIDTVSRDDWPYVDIIKCLDNENDCIITTNYDAMLDRAVCVQWGSARYSEYTKIFEKTRKPINLFKPLGSITWVPESFINDFTMGGTGSNAAIHHRVYDRLEKMADNPGIFVYKDIPIYFENSDNYPVIIPPVIGADVPDSWGEFFLEINKQMLHRIVNADEIFIIGYSFPEYYEYFRILVRKALLMNANDYKIFVVNYGEENIDKLKEKLKKYISKKEIKFYADGYDNWRKLFSVSSDIQYS